MPILGPSAARTHGSSATPSITWALRGRHAVDHMGVTRTWATPSITWASRGRHMRITPASCGCHVWITRASRGCHVRIAWAS
eukprot:6797707-Prymnesium_polylepis.1